jgi:Ca-activated chloride channel family protein
MTALADAGTGNYYYLRGAEDLATVFAREFTAARHTVATGLAVRIEPATGVRVVEAAGYPLEQTGDAVVFRPGSLFAGQRRSIWVTFAVPHDAPGEHALARIALAYTDGGEPVTLALAETPQVTCVGSEDDFYAHVDLPAWTRSIVQEGYNQMQDEVAREVKAGRREGALERIQRYRADVGEKNARLKSAPVQAQLESLEGLEADVKGAFVGPHASERQNVLSKTMSADALDQRRAGSKQ